MAHRGRKHPRGEQSKLTKASVSGQNLVQPDGADSTVGAPPSSSPLTTILHNGLELAFWLISGLGLGIIGNILTGKNPLPTPLMIVSEHPGKCLAGALLALAALRIGKIALERRMGKLLQTRGLTRKSIIPSRELLIAKSKNLLNENEQYNQRIVDVALHILQVPRLVKARHLRHGGRRASEASKSLNEPIADYVLRTERTLLVGRAGAGKTEILRKICTELLRYASADRSLPVPFILSLSTFSQYSGTLREWLAEGLLEAAAIPVAIGHVLLEQGQMFLLLDGLDEMPVGRQALALRELNALFKNADPALARCVIASRTQEYLAAGVPLMLPGALELQDITQAQIEDALAKAGTPAIPLSAALKRNPELMALLSTPLLLSISAIACARATTANLLDRDKALPLNKLFDVYVIELFRHRQDLSPYSAKESLHWIRWIAKYLRENQKKLFMIERLQPAALTAQGKLFLVFQIFCGITIGLSVFLADWIMSAKEHLTMGLKGIGIGLIFGYIWTATNNTITPVEKLHWSWSEAGRWWRLDLRNGLAAGVMTGVTFNAKIGCVLGITCYLGGFVSGGWVRNTNDQTAKPNQGVHASIYHGLREGLVSALIVGAVGALFCWKSGLAHGTREILGVGLACGLLAGVFVGLLTGIGEATKHYIMRILLYLEGRLPLRLVPWLEGNRARWMMRRHNGAYLFWHDTLQDYFTQLGDNELEILSQRIEAQNEYTSI